MLLVGNYYLDVRFGGVPIPLSPQMFNEVSITMDMDRILPTFKISVKDATGILGEVFPYDKNLNKVTIGIAESDNPNSLNNFNFVVKRRKPDSEREYQIEGILDVKDLLTSIKRRAIVGNIKNNLELIASDDLDIHKAEIGLSLDYYKTIIQPRWTDAKLFAYLMDNIIGKSGESCYYCFVKNVGSQQVLVFKSLDEILSAPVKYKLIVSPKPYEDHYPVVEYKIFDDSQLVIDYGAKNQEFGYFDYSSGEYVEDSIPIGGCPSLANRMLVDEDNTNDSVFFFDLGRSNDFTLDFHGKMKKNFYERINNFIGIWVTTWGLVNISPGDIVKLTFGEALVRGNMFLYEHSGHWMVKRVTHKISSSFMTNILLVRNGIETAIDTSLLKAENVKKNYD